LQTSDELCSASKLEMLEGSSAFVKDTDVETVIET